MIRPFAGAAFGSAGDGDGRGDPQARAAISAELGLPTDWAYLNQVHGATTLQAAEPGPAGDGDAVFTVVTELPLAVATADCVPIVVTGDGVAGVIHAGWRGLVAGIIGSALAAIDQAGASVERAAIGPAMGPCCYEVGPDVAQHFDPATTRDGRTSVDLQAAAAHQLGDLVAWRSPTCTMCGDGYHSYRRDGTEQRQVGVAWVPAS